jgi:hypothetical protein
MKTATRLIWACLLCFFVQAEVAYGQFFQPTCIDSLMITNNTCYGTTYQAICGCDNVTYRNECFAVAAGIINGAFTDGPCEFMDFDFTPNPAGRDLVNGPLTIRVICKGPVDINVWIFDTFFREKYYQRSLQFQEQIFQPDVRGWGNGLFFIAVEAGGVVKIKRLLVNQIEE